MVIAIVAAAIVAAIVLVVAVYAKNYIKVPPNQVAVFTGRKSQKVVRGGAKFKVPIIERVDFMSLEPYDVSVQASGIITLNGVPVNVDGVGSVRIGSTDEMIQTAAERFLTTDRNDLHRRIQEILASNMRGIVATMTVEALNNDREEFRKRVLAEAQADFEKLGMQIDVLNIQNITDPNGYIEAMGRTKIAEVRRDAEIGEANAQRDAQIAAAEAKRQGDTAQAEADTAIAQANRERDLELARIQALVDAERASAAQAGPRADAEAQRAVVIAQVAAEQARVEAEIGVERLRAQRATEAQQADVVVPAEAARQAALLRIEAEKAEAIARAEAEAEALRLSGSADADARKLAAEAKKVELLAEAEGQRAKMLAEAEGQEKMAEAYNTFSEEAARLSVLPQMIEQLPAVAKAVAEPVGAIQNLTVLDSGGNGQGVSGMVPQLLAQTLATAKAMGIDVGALLNRKPENATVVNNSANGTEEPVSF